MSNDAKIIISASFLNRLHSFLLQGVYDIVYNYNNFIIILIIIIYLKNHYYNNNYIKLKMMITQ